MSAHHATPSNDGQMYTLMTVVMASLVMLTTVLYLLAQLVSFIAGVSLPPSSVKEQALNDRLARVGTVVIGKVEPVVAAVAAEPVVLAVADLDMVKGEQVYGQVCLACHQTGAAGAPMLTAKADWEKRLGQGFGTLVSHAVKGYNAMPAKGGNAALSDADINHSIAYMLKEIGLSYE